MTTDEAGEVSGGSEPRVVDEPAPVAEEGLEDVVASLGQCLSAVEDVAARYTGLPFEHVLRALRRELRGFDAEDQTMRALAERLARGELPQRPALDLRHRG
jgi:hypothetical protein